MKKYILILQLTFGFLISGYSQDFKLPEQKYNGLSLNEKYQRSRHLAGISFGNHRTNILNESFYNLISNNKISRFYGLTFNIRFPIKFLVADVGLFKTEFNTQGLGGNLQHKGIESSVLLPLPFLTSVSSLESISFLPYIGTGWQSSQIAIINGGANISVAPMSAPLWKVGIMGSVVLFFFTIEYSQTYELNAPKSYNQFFITCGFRLPPYR